MLSDERREGTAMLSDEQFAEIEDRAHEGESTPHDVQALMDDHDALREQLKVEGEAREMLIEDGQRLRKRNAELEDENAALRERLAAVEADYEAVRDAIIERLAPVDDDIAESAILEQAVDHAAERLVAQEQREQQARAIFTLAVRVDFEINQWQRGRVLDQARAWLADRAEQRATAQEEASHE